MKVCSKCNIKKELNEFGKDKKTKDGLYYCCKLCRKLESEQYYKQNKKKINKMCKQYYEQNKDKRIEQVKQYCKQNKEKKLEYNKQYCKQNKEKIAKQQKQYYEQNKEKKLKRNKQYCKQNKEKILKYGKQYRKQNKEKLLEQKKQYYKQNIEEISKYRKGYRKQRYQLDPYFKFVNNLRRRILSGIKAQNANKLAASNILLGCSFKKCRQHLESLFLEGMNWDNHGMFGWHIDHIIPCSSFDLTIPEEQKKCFHYTNLQPLWAKDNISKGNKIDWELEGENMYQKK